MPVPIFSAESIRAIDHAAINDAGIAGYTLMTRAAAAALEAALAKYPHAMRWQIICGGGNNGGDGYVLARLAADRGIEVSVLALSPPESLRGDAATAWQEFAAAGGIACAWEDSIDPEADLLVDALLGSGLQRDVAGRFAEVVNAINEHAAAVLAIDIPSGLNADTGVVMGVAVRANLTVTFVGLKCGLFLGDGPDCVGELQCAELEIPPKYVAAQQPKLRRIDRSLIKSLLSPRRANAHKGDFGHVLVVGGGPGMSGAVRLCAEAALRGGAGLVSVATHPSHHAMLVSGRPELMCHAIESAADLAPLVTRATTIAVGPGLGTTEWSRALFDAALDSGLPLVVDADALNILSRSGLRRPDWILTPHPGEAARLLDCTTAEVQGDRCRALTRIGEQFGGTAVLKGSGSLVTSAAGAHWICTAGNPGMAAPGMGDVLTGIIAAMAAQGLPAEMAAVAGVYLHARAGDTAALAGERGLLASDVLQELRAWVNP
jgi:NAD(P)H-hydrate epimerase